MGRDGFFVTGDSNVYKLFSYDWNGASHSNGTVLSADKIDAGKQPVIIKGWCPGKVKDIELTCR